jgi:hypothetical protein
MFFLPNLNLDELLGYGNLDSIERAILACCGMGQKLENRESPDRANRLRRARGRFGGR